MTVKHIRLALTDRIRVHDFLKTVAKVATDGYVDYQDSWSDSAVARHLGVTSQNVWSIRTSTLGKLRHGPATRASKTSEDHTMNRIDALEARIAYLEKELGVTHK